MKLDIPKPLGCPFDGSVPLLNTYRAGCRDEPYRMVKMYCGVCGIQLLQAIPDSDMVYDEIKKIEKTHKRSYEQACMLWAAPHLVRRWNTRHST